MIQQTFFSKSHRAEAHQEMEMNKFIFNCIIFTISLCVYCFPTTVSVSGGTIGVNYGRTADDLPPPNQVVQLLQAQGITRVKLYDTDSTVLSALANTNISVTVALPNENLSSAATSQSYTDTWIQTNILPYYPSTSIEAIAVGNEVFADPNNTTGFLVQAMQNVQASLTKYNLASGIRISSPIALSCLQSSYPPSSGSFLPSLAESVVRPMLQILQQTGSYLMVDAYPFFAYIDNSDTIPLEYALADSNATGNTDSGNGLVYHSLFEAQIDAVYAAMGRLGFGDVRIVVSESGWPSMGDQSEIGAGEQNAAAYNGNLVRRVLTGPGTPLKPNYQLDVYIFALFNEDLKPGPTSERNYGLFYPNEQKVYNIPLTLADLESPNNGSKVLIGNQPQSWCVANGGVGSEKLQQALDYACGQGGADCRPIQPGATCYDPNTLVAHASYAFNSYYQMKAKGVGTCDFGGAAYVVTQPPKFGSCVYPTSN